MINLIFYLILLISIVNSIPFKFNNKEIPVPVVIWHGLGDRFDNPGKNTYIFILYTFKKLSHTNTIY